MSKCPQCDGWLLSITGIRDKMACARCQSEVDIQVAKRPPPVKKGCLCGCKMSYLRKTEVCSACYHMGRAHYGDGYSLYENVPPLFESLGRDLIHLLLDEYLDCKSFLCLRGTCRSLRMLCDVIDQSVSISHWKNSFVKVFTETFLPKTLNDWLHFPRAALAHVANSFRPTSHYALVFPEDGEETRSAKYCYRRLFTSQYQLFNKPFYPLELRMNGLESEDDDVETGITLAWYYLAKATKIPLIPTGIIAFLRLGQYSDDVRSKILDFPTALKVVQFLASETPSKMTFFGREVPGIPMSLATIPSLVSRGTLGVGKVTRKKFLMALRAHKPDTKRAYSVRIAPDCSVYELYYSRLNKQLIEKREKEIEARSRGYNYAGRDVEEQVVEYHINNHYVVPDMTKL